MCPRSKYGRIRTLVRDDQTILFRHSEFDAVFEIGNVKLTTRLLKGQFPDYQRLLPPSYPNQLAIARDAHGAAV